MFSSPTLKDACWWCLCVLALSFLPLRDAAAAAKNTDVQSAINTTRAEIEASDLDDTVKEQAIALIDAAKLEQGDATNLDRQLAELDAEIRTWPDRMEQMRQAIALDRDEAVNDWARAFSADADTETLERVLEQERNSVSEVVSNIDTVTAQLVSYLSMPAQRTADIELLKRRIEELSSPEARAISDSILLTQARDLRRISELRRMQSELALKQLERETAIQRQRMLELELGELRVRQEMHVRRIELVQSRIVGRARADMQSLIDRLAETAGTLADGPALSAGVADENLVIGNELLEQNEQLSGDRRALVEREQARLGIAAALGESRTRLELAGTSAAVGRWLWSERRNLEPPNRLRQIIDQERGSIADLRLRRVMVNEQKRELSDVPALAREMIERDINRIDDGETASMADTALEPLLRERLELLTLLDPLLQRRINTLEQTDRALTEQRQHTIELRALLDRYLLWAPSHLPLDASWLEKVPEGLYDLVKPSRVQATLSLTIQAIVERPFPWIGGGLILAMLIELRRRAPRHIDAQASVTRQIRNDSFTATAQALGWTLLAALPLPAAFLMLGELLQTVGSPGRYSDSLGRACAALALPLLAVQVMRWTSIERGLGHAHFRWRRTRRETVRRYLTFAAIAVLPLYFISSLAFIRNLDLPNDVQARLATLIACLILAWLIWQVLGVGRVWVIRGVEVEPSTLRKLLRIAIPASMLAVAVLSLMGYVYTAGILLTTILDSFEIIVAVALLTGLLGRWFLLGERRIAFRRLEERRNTAAQAAEDNAEPTPEPEAEVTLEQVNAQTGRLVRAVRLTLLATGLIGVWADLLPAVARLDEIPLWTITDIDGDGLKVLLPVSLMDVLFGAFALVLTLIGARNLPGLIEIGMQSYTRIDAGSRYAATSVLRYAIVIAGVVIGLGQFGMRWSQLQWLAAALTVGLGFGLQEIFANFVSGLILLFERPFRVGDIITVGDLSGRVTRIRTRATTILDFDNKEIVVPNKNFITGQLINWTLTDATTRVIVKVGVAYGTNPNRVHELLRSAARENSLVLSEPEPQSWFLAFGASSLDFELRVFVGGISDRLQVQDRLNTRIAELFAEQGIEIAFPQLDVHVRDLPAQPAP